jgi:hypothetical protein
MMAPARQPLTERLTGEGTAARSRTAVAGLAALGAGAGAGWLAARGWPAGAGDAGGDGGLLAAMAVLLAAGNGYAKAYSP